MKKNTDYQISMKDNISQVDDNISQVEDDISQVNLKTSYPSGIDNYKEDFVETFFDFEALLILQHLVLEHF